ncbi:hypothetical protein M075_3244 [Bacteroides fragilis str. 20793-3]|nr:hypothetical protein M075_3244 [Bacteroides fragilis str. 20793-3]
MLASFVENSGSSPVQFRFFTSVTPPLGTLPLRFTAFIERCCL